MNSIMNYVLKRLILTEHVVSSFNTIELVLCNSAILWTPGAEVRIKRAVTFEPIQQILINGLVGVYSCVRQ